jgi:uncharacterized protein (TIGR03086 family)
LDIDELFVQSTAWAATKLHGVRPEQLDDPTVLPDWTVRDLLNHMVGQHVFFAKVARGEPIDAPGGADLFGDDPAAAYREATAKAREAFSHQDALDRTLILPAGTMTGAQFWATVFTEALLHGWDLARSTGQDAAFDEELAAAAYEVLTPVADAQRELGFYGPEVPVPGDAPIQDRLLGLVGRSPSAAVA